MSGRDTAWWRHVLVLGGGAAAGQAIAIAAAPLLTRLYDAPAFGVFGLFNAVATTLGAVATLRFDQAIVLEPDEAQAGAVLRLVACWRASPPRLLTLLACLLFAAPLGPSPPARLLLAFCPLAVLAQGAFWSLSLWLTRAKLFRPLGLYQVARTGLGTAGQLGLAAGRRLARHAGREPGRRAVARHRPAGRRRPPAHPRSTARPATTCPPCAPPPAATAASPSTARRKPCCACCRRTVRRCCCRCCSAPPSPACSGSPTACSSCLSWCWSRAPAASSSAAAATLHDQQRRPSSRDAGRHRADRP